MSAMETALHLCDWTDITLHAPYLHLTKADIVKLGTGLGEGSVEVDNQPPAGVIRAMGRHGWIKEEVLLRDRRGQVEGIFMLSQR